MRDILRVDVAYSEKNLPEDIRRISFTEALALDNFVKKFAAFTNLGYKVKRIGVHEYFIQLDNIGVV
jgi:hypothetical protein